MYALPNKTQHKLIVNVRGGISQKLENFPSKIKDYPAAASSLATPSSTSSSSPLQDIHESGFGQDLDCLPQPVFHSINNRGNKTNNKSLYGHFRAQKQQYITPEHNEMIKYVQQSWKGVERDYKKTVNNYINTIDMKQASGSVKSKTATTSTPLLLTGSYHHSSSTKDSFQPFDLEAFWGNRILKSLTQDML